MQSYFAKGKTSEEFRFPEASEPKGSPLGAAAGSALTKFLPTGYRPFQDSCATGLPLQGDGSEYSRLVEYVGVIPNGHMRDGACPLQAEHTSTHTADGKGNM